MIAPATALTALVERLREANSARRPLRLRGGGSKDFYGEPVEGDLLDTRGLDAPAEHEPTELVVTAAAGMSVAALETQLAEQGQCLAFEPPHFGPGSTVGGMVAAGLSGPARARAGSLRDHLLGIAMLSGSGELMRFGGRVIKNVAGYDVSRLVAGSMGILGVIVEASLKVLPIAESEVSRGFEMTPTQALAALHAWGGEPLPLDASACWNGRLVVRLRGSAAAVAEASARLCGEAIAAGEAAPFWRGLRDQSDPFFVVARAAAEQRDASLWRLSLPQTAPELGLAGDTLIEWHGAQRWLSSAEPAAIVRNAAAAVGGHATLFCSSDKSAGVFTPLPPALQRIHERLKHAFDPNRILNPGRLYPGL